MKAIRISETGGPEVMHLEEIETPTPQEGQVLIKVAAAGVNYADIAQRQGTYLTRTRPPMTLGAEVAGTVAALGPGVSTPAVGTRVVAFGTGAMPNMPLPRPIVSFLSHPTSILRMPLPFPYKVLRPINCSENSPECKLAKVCWYMQQQGV